MPQRLSEDKKNLIRKRLLQDFSINDIAREAGVSRKTVSKYKKEIPASATVSTRSEDTDIQVDYSTILTKREAKIIEKVRQEMALYEDPVEGWTYHLTKHDDRIRQQGLWWSFIVYADSAPENWIEKLQATHMQIALSPWHDKDSWDHDSPEMVNPETGEIIEKGARYKVGDRKKMHRHGIIKCDKKASWREMNTLLQDILHCPYVQKCRSLRNAFDYFLHLNHPNKYQGYFKDEIIRLNGFVIEPTKHEQSVLCDEIVKVVIEHKFTRWTDVMLHYEGQVEYILLLLTRPAVITEILKDMWRAENPNYSRPVTITNLSLIERKENTCYDKKK